MTVLALLTELLFIGHSLIGPTLPGMVETAARHQGMEISAEYQIINGAPLRWNWDNGDKAEGVNARERIGSGLVDAVVLTEAVPLDNHLQWSDSQGHARLYHDLAVSANPQARVYLYETWHSINSGTGITIEHDAKGDIPWRQRLRDDLPGWQGIVDAVNATRPAGAHPMALIPAGQAMGALADAIDAGDVPGLTRIHDVFADDIHLNDRGLYFVALVMHAAITGRDPAGLPPRLVRFWSSRSTTVTEPMARKMQSIAWQAVQTQNLRGDAKPATAPPAMPAPAAVPSPDTRPAAAAALVPAAPPAAGILRDNLGFGLAGVTDWTVQQPFLDVFKTARGWIGHLPGQWGGWGHDDLARGGWLDADGWPKAIPPELEAITTLILTDLPPEAAVLRGRYVLLHDGKGTLRLEGRAQDVQAVPGGMTFDFSPGEGSVLVTLTRTDPADPIRNIRVVRQDRRAALDAGAVFNPDWIDRIRGVRLVRFMDWMATNDSPLSQARDRPKPGDYSWARSGVPTEVMVALANDLRADAWFTTPHLAEPALVREMAEIVHRMLAPGLRAYAEYSNEVWNLQFDQARWAEEQARARWGQDWKWTQFHAVRAAEAADIWAQVFADDPSRLVRVIGTQTGWKGLEHDMLTAPLWVAEAAGRSAPAGRFDAYAVTGYFAAQLGSDAKAPLVRAWLSDSLAQAQTLADRQGLREAARNQFIAAHRFDHAVTMAAQELRDGRHSGDPGDTLDTLLTDLLPYHADVARRFGLDLVMYEGGTHVVGLGAQMDDPALAEFFVHLNYTPEMAALYRDLLDGWAALSDAPFNAFVDVERPSRWGSWGALRHLSDDNPRWRVLAGVE